MMETADRWTENMMPLARVWGLHRSRTCQGFPGHNLMLMANGFVAL